MIENSTCEDRVGASGFYETFPPHNLIPAKLARIGWNTNDEGKVIEVLIVGDRQAWSVLCRDLRMSGGGCYSDWCVPVHERDGDDNGPDQLFDPGGAFGTLLASGFASKRVLRDALIQFAKIEEATWARRMLFAIEGEWNDADLEGN